MRKLASFLKGLRIIAVIPLLHACGGQQLPSAAPDTHQQGQHFSLATLGVQRRSDSRPALLYVVTRNGIIMMTYPQGEIVGSFTANEADAHACSDPSTGNVFIPQAGTIEEYAYGATTPISSLAPPKDVGGLGECSVDPITGSLAVVAGPHGSSLRGSVLVYVGGSGAAKIYRSSKMRTNESPAYDNTGNLFVVGYNNAEHFTLNELPAGGDRFMHITGVKCCNVVGKDQFDGTYLTIDTGDGVIGQVSVSGSTGKLVGQVSLAYGVSGCYWIQGNSIVAQSTYIKKKNNIGVGIWQYPSGGTPQSILYGITKGKKDYINDVTVSLEPSR